MLQKKKIAVEEKTRLVRLYIGGKISLSEAARKSGVSFDTVDGYIVSIYDIATNCNCYPAVQSQYY